MPCDGFWGFSGNFFNGWVWMGGVMPCATSIQTEARRLAVSANSGIIFQDVIEDSAYIHNLGIIDPRTFELARDGGLLGSRLRWGVLQIAISWLPKAVDSSPPWKKLDMGFFSSMIYTKAVSAIPLQILRFLSSAPRACRRARWYNIGGRGVRTRRGSVENCYTRGTISVPNSDDVAGGIATGALLLVAIPEISTQLSL